MRFLRIMVLNLFGLAIHCQADEGVNSTKLLKIKPNSGEPEWLYDGNANSTKLIKAKTKGNPDEFFKFDENKETGLDILTKEGQPGWMEKLLKEVITKKGGKKPSMNGEHERRKIDLNHDIPSTTLTKLTEGFVKLGSTATGAMNGLNKLKSQWNDIPFGDRAVMTQTLQAAASNLDKFANAGDDPLGAVQGAINMVSQFAALAGPTGQIVSVALSFVSGFLSLFGAGPKKQKSVGQIVREEIDAALAKYYEKTLANEAKGIISTFDVSKAYVDHLAQNGVILTVDQAQTLKTDVPLWQGLPLMGTLASEIRSLLKANKIEDANKALRYIELYAKIAIMKDMIMQETAALMPDELSPNRNALLAVQVRLRNTQKGFLKFLYESDLSNNIMPLFDPEAFPSTDSYLTTMLKVPNYDRSLAGIWCLTPSIYGKPLTPITWLREERALMKDGHPYISLKNEGCFWKLIPHGNYLFTVKNTYGGPGYDHFGKYLSADSTGSGMSSRATIEQYPEMWEIYGTQQRRIRNKYGCSTGSKWCNTQLTPQREALGFGLWSPRYYDSTFGLRKKNVGYIWYITKNPIKSKYN